MKPNNEIAMKLPPNKNQLKSEKSYHDSRVPKPREEKKANPPKIYRIYKTKSNHVRQIF